MKFTYAWADVSSQNVTLKITVLCLSVCVIVLGITATKLALKNPVVIERACYSKALSQSTAERSTAEIEAFIKEAISQRFNSDAKVTPGFFSTEEEVARNQEQKEFASRSMSQKVIVNSVKVTGNQVTVDADRLISVGQIRSAFSFPLIATIATEARTETNPYGLSILKISQPKTEEANAKK